jgi:hypothetical protein
LLGSNTTPPGFAAALGAGLAAVGLPRASDVGVASGGASQPVASPIKSAVVATLCFLRIIRIIVVSPGPIARPVGRREGSNLDP